MNIGRNDPCPCGSGKKYKKCCLLKVGQSEFEYRRQRQVEADMIPLLLNFAFEVLGPESVHEAWREFNDDDEVEELTVDDPMNIVFMPWFLFNYLVEFEPDDKESSYKTTIGELFLETYQEELTDVQNAFLHSVTRPPYTLCEILEVTPGNGLKLRCLFREREYEVVERTASKTLMRGQIIYCATTELNQLRSNIGIAPFPLRPIHKREVLQLRSELIDEVNHSKLDDDDLFEFEADIRGLYLHLLAGMFAPPIIVNTDKDPFLLQKLYFDLDSVDDAFHKLKDLAGEENDERLLADATIEHGRIVAAQIPWNGGSAEAQKRHGGQILLGLLSLRDKQLVTEVNSTNRAERIRKLVEERLGDQARYKTTLIEPIEGMLEEAWEEARNRSTTSASTRGASADAVPSMSSLRSKDWKAGDSNLDPQSPEVKAILKKTAQEHWSTWFDIAVPALDNMTPRQAATTPEGRDLLESLLLDYEVRNERTPNNISNPDFAALRRELGMK